MAKYIYKDRSQTTFVPICLKDQLQEGTFEHALDYLIEHKMDLSIFERRYKNDEVGRPAWNPATMLRIILFAYSRGIFTSREIARACEENVTFMALSGDSRPHYTSIADFITSMEVEVGEVFQEILVICSELELIGGEMLAIDGCKISSNASKEWSGTKAQLRRKKEKIERVIKDLMRKHRRRDKEENDEGSDDRVHRQQSLDN